MLYRSLVMTALVVGLVACAVAAPTSSSGPDTPVSDDPAASQDPGAPDADGTLTVSGETIDGPALEIPDALAAADGPVRVAGALFVGPDGRVLLCSALAESFPPQCGGDRLEVVGLDLDTVAELQDANGVRWAEGVELSGTID